MENSGLELVSFNREMAEQFWMIPAPLTSFTLQHFIVCILALCPPNARVRRLCVVFAYVYARADEPVKVGIRIHCTILHPSHDCLCFLL